MDAITPGLASQSTYFFLRDSTTGLAKTGLAYNSPGAACYYTRQQAAAVQVTLASLATPAAAYSSGGFIEVSAANAPGLYRFDLPDAATAIGSRTVIFTLQFTGVIVPPKEIFTSYPVVDVMFLRGSATNAIDLADFASLGYDDTTHRTKANLQEILDTQLTETSAGYLAAALKKLLDVETPLLTASEAMRGTDNAPDAAAINAEVVDALMTDTYAEPGQGTPAATASLAAKIGYLYKAWRNKATQTATEYNLYADDATTVDQKATVSDTGTTATKGEIATGP